MRQDNRIPILVLAFYGVVFCIGLLFCNSLNDSHPPNTDTIHFITIDTPYKSYDERGNLYGCEIRTIDSIKIIKYKLP